MTKTIVLAVQSRAEVVPMTEAERYARADLVAAYLLARAVAVLRHPRCGVAAGS